jgi:phospholipid/cholesterol/gamma-HCH transport system substrate-binding protein
VTRKREILVGVVVILGVLLGVFGTLWLQGMSLARSTVIVDSAFEDVGQLMEGNSVKYRGVSIGRVASIEVAPDGGWVLARLRVSATVDLPSQAGVVASPESMFGDWQVEIVSIPNSPLSYEFFQDQMGALPGYALPDMSELTEQARVIADRLTTIMQRVEIAFTPETAENLAAAIDNIEGVSERIALLVDQQAESFTQMTAQLNRAATQVGDAAGAVESTFARVDSLVAQEGVDSLVTDLRGVASNLREASQAMTVTAENLQGTLHRADSTFAYVNRIAAQIESGTGGIGRLVSDTSLVVRAEGALAQLNYLLEDLRQNPKRYFRLSIF